jgi:hypothetical protein
MGVSDNSHDVQRRAGRSRPPEHFLAARAASLLANNHLKVVDLYQWFHAMPEPEDLLKTLVYTLGYMA